MAKTIKWTEDASDDIISIAEYISRDSEFYASAVVQKIINKILEIPSQPEIGRIVPEIEDKNIRERFVYSYRIIYKIIDEIIWTIGIIHGKKLLLQD